MKPSFTINSPVMLGNLQGVVKKIVSHDQLIKKRGAWSPTGSEISAVKIGLGGTEALYLEKGGDQFLFRVGEEISSEQISALQKHAKRFGQQSQRAGSVQFRWNDIDWDMLDIGRTTSEEGLCRFILAKSSETYLFVLDHKDPGYRDLAWIGTKSNSGLSVRWKCEHCGTINKAKDVRCSQCGAGIPVS